MPTVLRLGPYRFYFFAQDCAEPRHTHVDRDDQSVKFWLDPDVYLAHNYGFGRAELKRIEQLARENRERLRHGWDDFCGDADAAAGH